MDLDYRKLLLAYMARVLDREGTLFLIGSVPMKGLTTQEHGVLEQIAAEALSDFTGRDVTILEARDW